MQGKKPGGGRSNGDLVGGWLDSRSAICRAFGPRSARRVDPHTNGGVYKLAKSPLN
jgi:hypothetical protein